MKKPLVSIIIANYNGGTIFNDCIKSLEKITYPNWELIVVDNGSSDNSLDSVKKSKITNAQIIQNEKNVGFAPANNQGYEVSKGAYVLFLNNDTKVDPDFLNPLVDYLEQNSQCGVLQPKIYLMDKPKYLDNAGSFLNKTGFLEHWGFMEKDSSLFDQVTNVFSVKGACMLVRRDVIEKIGLFDADFDSYFEETDFCWRAWISGYTVAYVPKSHIYHKVGFTSKKQSQIFVNYNSFKNRLRSLLKNLEIPNLFMIGTIHLILILGLSIYYLFKLQFSKSWMIIHAVIWNITHIANTLSLRNKIQRMREVRDSEIFQYGLKPISIPQMFSHFAKVEKNFK